MSVNGEGSIFQRKGKWIAQIVVGRDTNGKQIKKTKTCKTEEEAGKALDALKLEKGKGELTPHSNMLFTNFIQRWLNGKKAEVCNKTYMDYEVIVNRHFLPYFGHQQIGKIKTAMINNYLQKYLTNGTAISSVRKHKGLLNNIFSLAVSEEIISRNPVENSKNIPSDRTEVTYIDDVNIRRILNRAKEISESALSNLPSAPIKKPILINGKTRVLYGSRNCILYSVLLTAHHTGMRLGEILALRWKNIDIDNKTIYVCEKIEEVKDKHTKKFYTEISPPKRNSIRTIAIDQALLDNLLSLKKADQDIVFLSKSKTYIRPSSFETAWRNLLKDLNLEGEYHIHELRHTHATEVIGNGGNIKAISQRLGHKDIRTTLNVYTAALSKNDAAIAAMFEKDK